jgi:hypothetical protein
MLCAESSIKEAAVRRRSAIACAYKKGLSVEPGWRSAVTPSTSAAVAERARRAHPGQHLAAGVVQHHHARHLQHGGPANSRSVAAGVCTAKRCRGARSVVLSIRRSLVWPDDAGEFGVPHAVPAHAGPIVAPLQCAGGEQVQPFAIKRTRAGLQHSLSTLQARCATCAAWHWARAPARPPAPLHASPARGRLCQTGSGSTHQCPPARPERAPG